eukprot:5233419-Pleurochrysis_carterae.AAC.1
MRRTHRACARPTPGRLPTTFLSTIVHAFTRQIHSSFADPIHSVSKSPVTELSPLSHAGQHEQLGSVLHVGAAVCGDLQVADSALRAPDLADDQEVPKVAGCAHAGRGAAARRRRRDERVDLGRQRRRRHRAQEGEAHQEGRLSDAPRQKV